MTNRDNVPIGSLIAGLTVRTRVAPESFTHGTSAQRVEWLRRGLESGRPADCDTFN